MGKSDQRRLTRAVGTLRRLREWRRLTIRRRILVAMLGVSVIPLAIFGLAGLAALSGLNSGALNTATSNLETSQNNHLSDLVGSKAVIVNNELQSVQNELALVSQSARNLLSAAPPAGGGNQDVSLYGTGSSGQGPALEALGAQMLILQKIHPEVAQVWAQVGGMIAVSPEGSVPSDLPGSAVLPPPSAIASGQQRLTLATSKWQQLEPSPNQAAQRAIWTPVYGNPVDGGDTVTVLTKAVAADGAPFLVGANITVKNIVSTFLESAPESGQGAYAFLVSSSGQLLSTGPGGAAQLGVSPKHKGSANVDLTSNKSPWYPAAIPMEDGLSGQKTLNLSGDTVVVFYSPLPASEWSLGVAVPVSAIDGSVVGFSNTISHGLFSVTALLLPIVVVLAVLVVLVTNLLSGRLIKPLGRLTEAAGRIASGDLGTPVDATREAADEIGTLEGALERMRIRLRGQRRQIEAARRQLERRVEQRTSELSQRNHELATLNALGSEISRSLVIGDVATAAALKMLELPGVEEVSVYLEGGLQSNLQLVGHAAAEGVAERDGVELRSILRRLDSPPDSPVRDGSVVAVPLVAAGVRVGYLLLHTAAPVSEGQLELLQLVGGQLALALRNAQLFVDTQELATINERNRIAREIHDTLAQGLAGIIIQLQAADGWLGRDEARARHSVAHATELARSSLQEARRSVWDLRPEVLQRSGLAGALREELGRIGDRHGVNTSIRVRARRLNLPARTEVAVFRVAQEALSNSVRHGQPSVISVELRVADGQLVMTIADDGAGFDPSRPGRAGAFGLTSMSERAAACGGEVAVTSHPGSGSQVEMRVPLPESPTGAARR